MLHVHVSTDDDQLFDGIARALPEAEYRVQRANCPADLPPVGLESEGAILVLDFAGSDDTAAAEARWERWRDVGNESLGKLACGLEGRAEIRAQLVRAGVDGFLDGEPASAEWWEQWLLAVGRLSRCLRVRDEREARLSAFVRHSVFGYVEIGLDGRLTFVNDRAAEIFGYRANEVTGYHFTEFLDPSEAGRATSELQRLLTEDSRGPFEYKAQSRGGQVIYVAVSGQRLMRGGEAVGYQCNLLDVTERRRAREALRRNAQRDRAILGQAMDAFLLVGMDGQLLEVNEKAAEIFGIGADDLLKMHAHDLDVEHSISEAKARIERIKTEGSHRFESRARRADGAIIDIEVSAEHVEWRDGGQVVFAFVRDVTQRNERERQLRHSEARLRALLTHQPDLVALLDREGVVSFVNRGTAAGEPESFLGRRAFDFAHPDFVPLCRNAIEETFRTGEVQSVEMLDVFGVWWLARIVPLDSNDTGSEVLMIATDITERRRAREAVQSERKLLRELLDLQERDRRLIAYEIHDGVAQKLTATLYQLQAAQAAAEKAHGDAKSFTPAIQLLTDSIAEVRRLIGGLRPPILDELGIVAALDYLVAEYDRDYSLQITMEHDLSHDRLASALESNLFRIVQESLTNACRHSHSQKVAIRLWQADKMLRLEVEDWGVGFDPEEVPVSQFGLRGIRERARLLGGSAEVFSRPGEGTRIVVNLPLIVPPPASAP